MYSQVKGYGLVVEGIIEEGVNVGLKVGDLVLSLYQKFLDFQIFFLVMVKNQGD